MRSHGTALFVLLALAVMCHSARADQQCKAIKLFNGKCLDGWQAFLVDPDVKMEDVWSVEDGILICKGEPLGYLYTKKKYTNFRLTLQWRWAPGKEPGNSGVLLRIAGGAVSFLPRCVEAQLKSGSAGDLWAFYGAKLKGAPERMKVIKAHKTLGDFMGVARIKDAENEPGQWNTYEITLDQGNLTVVINGQKVNEATDCDIIAGSIGLQSEGAEIHFRNIRLTELPCR